MFRQDRLGKGSESVKLGTIGVRAPALSKWNASKGELWHTLTLSRLIIPFFLTLAMILLGLLDKKRATSGGQAVTACCSNMGALGFRNAPFIFSRQ